MIDPFLKGLPNTWFKKMQEVSKRGIPDYILCINGLFVGMEVKIDKKNADPLQTWNLEHIELAKGISIVAKPSNWERISKVLTILSGESNLTIKEKKWLSR